jgi:uncharacterized coiled-coil protein SlyX
MEQLQQHITEYRKQLETAQRQVVALTGAIQALERLEREQGEHDGDE